MKELFGYIIISKDEYWKNLNSLKEGYADHYNNKLMEQEKNFDQQLTQKADALRATYEEQARVVQALHDDEIAKLKAQLKKKKR